MSNIGYFSDMFHYLGDLTITLNDALNLLVRSYRTKVSEKDKEEAKRKLSSLLSIVLENNKQPQTPWDKQISEVLKTSLDKKGGEARLDLIRQKIGSGERLSSSDIGILDDLISRISQQATVAFRKMKKAI
jgi:hypothetical protein